MALSEALQKKINSRKKYNDLILYTTQFTEVEKKYPGTRKMIQEYIGDSEFMRFGQAVCNTVCSDYRNEKVSNFTYFFMNRIFSDIKMDPFYEEPYDTYIRLITELKNTPV